MQTSFAISIYLTSFKNLQKASIEVPTFIEDMTIVKKDGSKKLLSDDLDLQISELCTITHKYKLSWVYKGNWWLLFKKIDNLLLNLSTYKDKLDKQAETMRKFRATKNVDLNKFSKDIKIIAINPSTNRYRENNK